MGRAFQAGAKALWQDGGAWKEWSYPGRVSSPFLGEQFGEGRQKAGRPVKRPGPGWGGESVLSGV